MSAEQKIECLARTDELQRLQAQLARMLQGEGGLHLIRGDMGTGKSTLLEAFTAEAEKTTNELVIAWGRCDQHADSTTSLRPWRGVLNSLTGVTIDAAQASPQTTRKDTVRTTIRELGPDLIELLIPGVGLVMRSARLLGSRTPIGQRLTSFLQRPAEDQPATLAADRSKLMTGCTAILEKTAAEQPLLIILEDLHWADQTSLELLHKVSAIAQQHRMLILGSLRATTSRDNPLLQTLSKNATLLDLDTCQDSFGPAFTQAYVTAVAPGLDQQFVDDLWRHTEGHALFVSELMDALIVNQQLVKADATWRVSRTIDWTELPDRLEELIREQLAAIDDKLREILEVACIEGETFTVEIVAHILGIEPLAVVRALKTDNQSGTHLAEPVGTTLLGETRVAQYRFTHSLYSNYLYGHIEDIECAYLHDAVANRLEEMVDGADRQIVATLAYHFERGQNTAKSAIYHEAAAVEARKLCALQEAAMHIDKALAYAATLAPEQRARIVRVAARLARERGQLEQSHTLLENLLPDADNLAALDRAQLFADYASLMVHRHELADATQFLDQASALAEESGDPATRAHTLRVRATLQTRTGDFAGSLTTLRQVYALHTQTHVQPDQILCDDLFRIGWALKEIAQNEEAEDTLKQSLDMQRKLADSDWALMARTQHALADLYMNEERYSQARAHLKEAIKAWSKFDQHAETGDAQNALANLANRVHRYTEGLDYASQAYENYLKALGPEHPDIAFPLTCKGEALLGLKRFDEAISTLQEALKIRIDNHARPGNIAWTRWLLGRTLTESSTDPQLGLNYVHQARADLAALGAVTTSEVKEIDAWLARYTAA